MIHQATVLTRLVTPGLADSTCFMSVSDDGQLLGPLAYVHANPQWHPLVTAAATARYQRGEGIPGRVWSTGRGILIPEVDTRALEETAHVKTRAFLRGTALSSLIAVPIIRGDEVTGVLVVGRDQGSPAFTERDYELVERITREWVERTSKGAADHDKG